MRVISLKFNVSTPVRVAAIQGEHHAAALAVDVGSIVAEYPMAWFSVVARREGDAQPYVAEALMYPERGRIIYKLSCVDTARSGQLTVEVQARDGDSTVIKSCAFAFLIARSLCLCADEPEATPPDWTGEVIEAAERCVNASAQTEAYRNEAAVSAASALESAQATAAGRLSLFITVGADGHARASSQTSLLSGASIDSGGSLTIQLEVA